jgi:hypothetical protein
MRLQTGLLVCSPLAQIMAPRPLQNRRGADFFFGVIIVKTLAEQSGQR